MSKKPARASRAPHPKPAPTPAAVAGDWHAALPRILLAATVALLAASVLVTGESAVAEGGHAVLSTAWVLLFAVWAAVQVGWQRPIVRLAAVDGAILSFLFLHSLSAVVMARWGHGRPALNVLWVWLTFGMAFFLVRDLASTATARRTLVAALMAGSVGLTTLAWFQYTVSFPEQWARYRTSPELVLQEAGLEAPAGSPLRRQFEDRLFSTEPLATFALANSLAGFLVPGLVVLAGLAMSRGAGLWQTWRGAGAVVLSGGLLITCLVLTKSRTAVLAVLAGIGMLGVVQWGWKWTARRWPAVVLAVIILVTASAALVGGLLKFGVWDPQVLTEAPKSIQYRLEFWDATAALIADHPWLGCGPGNFQQYYTQYKLPAASETVADPHNFLLEIAATTGIPALLLLLAAVVALLLNSRSRSGAEGGTGARGNAGDQYCPADMRAVAGGLVLGLPVAFLAGWPLGQPPDLSLLLANPPLPSPVLWLLVIGPVSALTYWLLLPWVRSGELAPSLVTVSLLALLINLLAAGGVGTPGLGHVAWVLAALAWPVAVQGRAPAATGLVRGVAVAIAAVAAALVVCCYFTLYRPVLGAQQHLMRAQGRGLVRERVQELELTAAVDPWWSRPAEHLADLWYHQWTTSPSPDWEAHLQAAVEQALDRNRHASSLYRRFGDYWLQMYVVGRDRRHVEAAVAAYERAAQLYPNSNILQAQLAWGLLLAGQDAAARRAAERALELDGQVPHEELKLAAQTLTGRGALPALPAGANAEQVAQFVRTR